MEQLNSYANRIKEITLSNCRVILLNLPVPSVVSFVGSFVMNPDFAEGEQIIQELAVSLLDKGTKLRDRFAIADIIDQRGAVLNFQSRGLRTGFSGRCLSEHTTDLIGVLIEQLTQPLFDEKEFQKSLNQMRASVRRSMESTASQASGLLTRAMYSHAHPNYTLALEDELNLLDNINIDSVREYYHNHLGAGEFFLTFVGDIEHSTVIGALEEELHSWPIHTIKPSYAVDASNSAPCRLLRNIPDKANVDVRMGHPVRPFRQDPDYIPLFLGNFALGGNFSSRLMANVRDELGLTYGIHSSLQGISTLYRGYWLVGVTLSKENIELGIEATIGEISKFIESGIVENEAETVRSTIVGSYKVALATTGGFAAALLGNAERGFGIDYIDRYPEEVAACSTDRINSAIHDNLSLDGIHIAASGSVQTLSGFESR